MTRHRVLKESCLNESRFDLHNKVCMIVSRECWMHIKVMSWQRKIAGRHKDVRSILGMESC